MGSYSCFVIVPTTRAREYLRRYEDRACEGPHGYHNASVTVGEVLYDPRARVADDVPHSDPRWPRHCGCGYVFPEDGWWLHGADQLWAAVSGGMKPFVLRDAPPGAMWYADWMAPNVVGPDGGCLVVQTAAGAWTIDGPASSGGGWTRTGTPPFVTAHPSIRIGPGRGEGGGDRYHGWLRNGVLVDA